MNFSSLFSESLNSFPLDLTYAHIEVKTTLNQNELRDSIKKIANTKKMSIIKGRKQITDHIHEDQTKFIIFYYLKF